MPAPAARTRPYQSGGTIHPVSFIVRTASCGVGVVSSYGVAMQSAVRKTRVPGSSGHNDESTMPTSIFTNGIRPAPRSRSQAAFRRDRSRADVDASPDASASAARSARSSRSKTCAHDSINCSRSSARVTSVRAISSGWRLMIIGYAGAWRASSRARSRAAANCSTAFAW
jgi:hypothetical protein